jgi:hypothetical protein
MDYRCAKYKGDLKTSHIPLLMPSAKAMVHNRIEGIDLKQIYI